MLVEIKLNAKEVALNSEEQKQDNQMWLSLPGTTAIEDLPDGGQVFSVELSTEQIIKICSALQKYSLALKTLKNIFNNVLKVAMKEWLQEEESAKELCKELDELFDKF